MGPYPMTVSKMFGRNAYLLSISGPAGMCGYGIIGSPSDLWQEAAYRYGKMLPRLVSAWEDF